MPEESHPLILAHKLWCHLFSSLWTTSCLLDPLCASLNIQRSCPQDQVVEMLKEVLELKDHRDLI